MKHKNATHGLSKTLFYKRWRGMFDRCSSPNNKDYKHWGGRGIAISNRWQKFENFRDDMYDSYLESIDKVGIKNTTLERINVDGNYTKSNCRWATQKEQRRNSRSNRMLTFNKKTQCLSAWAEEFNICRKVLRYRLENNWPLGEALTIKINHGNNLRLGRYKIKR